ncbi:hypothetical protein GCM10011452_04210 [Gemmobacter lanyuensis]|uniref:DUF1499 domain-containing protein n=1 Tax=Gemmobacter lanyuensis TaxID=1054497 RepID=A0A918ILH9_9RHOB|nr:DUF1499 domain-containing protein [Gemmobacter lanyuensis]GGW21950.1 hypothetical protein GCM10011452_04210 [Gemmobacter lanyuensis]
MKWLLGVTFGLPLLAVLVAMAFVRLTPLDPARWHVSLASAPRSIKPNDVTVAPTGADLSAPVLPLTPQALAERIQQIALAEPRTQLMAGSVAQGRLTFVQRSRIWGFPDVITVETFAVPGGATLRLWSRARFGYSDFGVNRARAERWLAALTHP